MRSRRVSETRIQDFDRLYQYLGIKKGEKSIYMLTKGRERKTRDLDQMKCGNFLEIEVLNGSSKSLMKL